MGFYHLVTKTAITLKFSQIFNVHVLGHTPNITMERVLFDETFIDHEQAAQ
jgi:hypothetical protein